MTAKPELKLFTGGEEREAIHGPKGRNDVKQSGCRLAVRVTKEIDICPDDRKKWHVAWMIASRHSDFTNLNRYQQKLAYEFIERFLDDQEIPNEDIIIDFIDDICAATAKVQLPEEPHNGDTNQIKISAENEKEYSEYLRALSKATALLENIFQTHLAIHKTVLSKDES